jgi:hypothetical protein
MKPITLKQFISLEEDHPLLSPVARFFIEQRGKPIQKSIKGQAGGVLQNNIANALLREMPPHLQGKIEIVSNFSKGGGEKGIGSVQPDITIYKLDKSGKRTGDPIVIEVKKEEAQGVSITLNRNSKKWTPTQKSLDKWNSMSIINRNSVLKKLKVVEARLDTMLPVIGRWMDDKSTESGNIHFWVSKEIWNPILKKYTTQESGEKWRITLDSYWATLQGLAKNGGDHFVYIENIGLLYSGASTPSWFAPKTIPMISSLDKMDASAREMEVRLKRGSLSEAKVSLKRKIRIQAASIDDIKVGKAVYMEEGTLSGLAKTGAVDFNTSSKTIKVNGQPYIYSMKPFPAASGNLEIGKITQIHGKPVKVGGINKQARPMTVFEVSCTIESRKARVTFAIAPRVEGSKSKTTANKGIDLLSKQGAGLFWSCVK